MKLNLTYYNGKDEYSDGNIETTIIDLIKKYSGDYEKALKENSSWPVYYHLSNLRKNVIRWYPFDKNGSILEIGAGMGALTDELCNKCKKVTSIELSKRRATAILERNKNRENLEIIVGNFNDIKFTEKFDYIILNGVLEYAALYIDSNNPYEDLLKKLKEYLKDNGKILVAIENRFGLKYWCGANEDHTDVQFDGLNNYPSNKKIRTFSKVELENIVKNLGMSVNFYYMFPDYKFPKVIYTDNSLSKGIFTEYSPYYCKQMNMILYESKIYKEIYENNEIPFFANSYFLEISNEKANIEIEYVKFNNDYRKKEYDLMTYLKDNKFYKEPLFDEGKKHIDNILDIQDLIKKNDIKMIENKKHGDIIYTDKYCGELLSNKLINYYNKDNYGCIEKEFDNIYDLLLKCAGKKISKLDDTLFEYYDMKIPKNIKEKMNFYEQGLLDVTPNNIFVDDSNYILIDQEWYAKNCPIEYMMYRAIRVFLSLIDNDESITKKLYNKYNINDTIFEQLEINFLNKMYTDEYFLSSIYRDSSNSIINVQDILNNNKTLVDSNEILNKEINRLNNEIDKLNNEKNSLGKELDNIYNSRGYKLLNKFYKTKDILRKKK